MISHFRFDFKMFAFVAHNFPSENASFVTRAGHFCRKHTHFAPVACHFRLDLAIFGLVAAGNFCLYLAIFALVARHFFALTFRILGQ